MYRAAYRNFGDHEAIVVNHAVTVGTSVGVRWYELRGVTTTPSLFQAGTYAPDCHLPVDGQRGDGSGGQHRASAIPRRRASIKPQIRVTGRLAGDAAGTLTLGETTIIAGAGAQGSTLTRWGDYSSMSVDPVDDCTFYYTNRVHPGERHVQLAHAHRLVQAVAVRRRRLLAVRVPVLAEPGDRRQRHEHHHRHAERRVRRRGGAEHQRRARRRDRLVLPREHDLDVGADASAREQPRPGPTR